MYNDLDYKKKVVVGLIITFALPFFCAGVSLYQYFLPVITIKVNDVTIRQEENLPEFQVEVEYSGKEDLVLDEKTGYTVSRLLEELKQGKGYELQHNGDYTKEGSYALELKLTEDLKKQFVYSWNQKLRYQCEQGVIQVLNKYGDWEGEKFKLLDGTYASGWLNMGDDTYYFDENGAVVTGEVEITGNTYYFSKDGKFDSKKNPINPNRPMVALTFDDGPGMYTMRLLEQMEAFGAKGTFYLLGTRVNTQPEAVRKMVEMGCELGNHTTNHVKLTLYPPETVVAEIQDTAGIIQSAVGQLPTSMRPPYGDVNEAVQSVAATPIVLWSNDTYDWQLRDANLVRDAVLNSVRDGDVVLFHDIYESTVQAVCELIPLLQERGYQLVTVSELARTRGVTLENGVKYFSFYPQ